MKLVKKIMATTMVFGLVTSFAAINASAAPTPQTGTSFTLTKYLVMPQDANVPNLTFDMNVTAGTAGGTIDGLPVFAGIVPTSWNMNAIDATFAPTDTTYAAYLGGAGEWEIGNAADKDAMTANGDNTVLQRNKNKYVKKSFTLDFSGITFPEPGIYRYVITEDDGTTQGGVVYDINTDGTVNTDNAKTRYLDVYVQNNLDANNSPTGINTSYTFVMHKVSSDDGSEVNTTKTDYLINKYDSQNLEFGKEVTGNQASMDKYFKFNVSIKDGDVQATDKFTVEVSDKTPTENTATTYSATDMQTANNITELTGAQLIAGYDFYLKDGQYIKILGLPKGAEYTITETPEEYTSTEGITAALGKGGVAYSDNAGATSDNTITGTLGDTEAKTGFTNTREGTIPTGVIFTVAPFAIGILLFGSVMFFMVSRRRREEY